MAATPIAELLLLPRRERLALAMALWESLDEVGRSESLPMDRELGEELPRFSLAVPWVPIPSWLSCTTKVSP